MAVIKFYKKLSPATEITLDNGNKLPAFKSLDSIVGYYATNQEYVQQQFEKCMREGRYALTEISEVEFHENFVKKKESMISRPVWREEVAKTAAGLVTGTEAMTRMAAEGSAAAVAVKGCDAPGRPCGLRLEADPVAASSSQVLANESISTNITKQEFKPPAGKRSRGNRPTGVATKGPSA